MSDSTFKPLTITPVAFSLTEGTNIPAPPDSPPPTPGREADAGSDINGKAGGPLSSHPTTPEGIPGAFPPSPSTDAEKKDNDDVLGSLPPNLQLSPNNNTQKRPSSVRRLLSLRSIRSEKERHSEFGTPTSPLSPTDSKMSADDYSSSGRPGSPYTISTIMSSNSGKAKLSRKRSSAWFGSGRRKSGFFPLKVEGLEEERESVRRGPPPPSLPEFREFRSLGEALDGGGDLGAEEMFKDIK